MVDSRPYAERRARFLAQMGEGVAVFPAAPVALRNNDVEHAYRQDSDFYYLTGFDEPESVLVLVSAEGKHKVLLFVRPRDPSREVWDGPRAGIDGAVRDFGADVAYPIAELGERLPEVLANVKRLHYRLGRDRYFDDRIFEVLDRCRGRARTGVTAPSEIVDPGVALHEMRLRKTAAELQVMRRAAEITREAHVRAMAVARPGNFEYEVEAELLRTFRAYGSERPAYGSIVGSGENATILHYRKNDRRMEDGDLLLIDAGAEYGYYACDVTRTFPVNGRFSPEQREIYQIVLDAQAAAIEAVRPGATMDDVHSRAVRVIAEGLVRIGLCEGTVDDVIDKETYRAFYMHRTSHWLGMDVHDVGPYFVEGKPRKMEPGFVLTVEPGIYVSASAPVDPKWRGIGVRIEDDVVVTADGHDILTNDVPRTVAEIEGVLAARA